MKRFFRKYAVPVIAVVCVLALSGAWTGVRLSADAGTYRLDDLEGDRAYLNGVRIDMALSDAAHTQHITLDSGTLSHSCSFTSPLAASDPVLFSNSQMFVESPGATVQESTETTLQSSGEDYAVWITQLTRKTDEARVSVQLLRHGANSPSQWAQVVTDVTVSGDGYPFEFTLERETTVYTNQHTAQGDPLPDTTSESPFDYAGTSVGPASEMGYSTGPLTAEAPDGTVYFTPSLMPYYGGTSAIWRVDEWITDRGITEASATVDGYPCFPDSNALPWGTVSTIAEFPAENLRTVALDVVNDHLCLLLMADGTLTLRVYGLDGTFEHELPLFDMDPELSRTSTLFTNESGGSVMLCYYLQDPAYASYWDAPPESDPQLMCIRLGDTTELVSVLTGRDTLVRAGYVGGHWVLTETAHMDGLVTEQPIPERHYISVLDASGAVLYRGEIMTDQYEDEIQYYVSTGTETADDFSVSRWLTFEEIMEG